MSKALPCGGDITANFLEHRVATSLGQNMEQYCGGQNITTLKNMEDAHPLDNFPLSLYKRKNCNNMEKGDFWTKFYRLNTNDYDEI
jgi:hypothetical protein